MKQLSLLIFILSSITLCAQQKIKTIEINDTIIFATVDRPGDIYIVTKNGQIQKFDKDGMLILVYKNKTVPTLFDPRDGAKLFAYYRDQQQYDYYNPSFETKSSFRIDSAFEL